MVVKREPTAFGWHYAVYGKQLAFNLHTNSHRRLRSGVYWFRTVGHPKPFGVMCKIGHVIASLQIMFLKRL